MRKSIRIDLKCKIDIKQMTKTDVIKNNVILSKLILGLIGSRRDGHLHSNGSLRPLKPTTVFNNLSCISSIASESLLQHTKSLIIVFFCLLFWMQYQTATHHRFQLKDPKSSVFKYFLRVQIMVAW